MITLVVIFATISVSRAAERAKKLEAEQAKGLLGLGRSKEWHPRHYPPLCSLPLAETTHPAATDRLALKAMVLQSLVDSLLMHRRSSLLREHW